MKITKENGIFIGLGILALIALMSSSKDSGSSTDSGSGASSSKPSSGTDTTSTSTKPSGTSEVDSKSTASTTTSQVTNTVTDTDMNRGVYVQQEPDVIDAQPTFDPSTEMMKVSEPSSPLDIVKVPDSGSIFTVE